MKSLTRKTAIEAINKHGMLLVFPIDNASAPQSLWSVAYPRTKMRWEWDESGDDRVGKLWHLREQLSRSGEVVYSKWYRGRATVFSKPVFSALLAQVLHHANHLRSLSSEAQHVLDVLESNSPLSTKQLKDATDMKGRTKEAAYNRALKELWSRHLIVAFGEVDEGAFPSIAIGATRVIFEDLFDKAKEFTPEKAAKLLEPLFETEPLAQKFHAQVMRSLDAPARPKVARKGYIEFGDWNR